MAQYLYLSFANLFGLTYKVAQRKKFKSNFNSNHKITPYRRSTMLNKQKTKSEPTGQIMRTHEDDLIGSIYAAKRMWSPGSRHGVLSLLL